MNVRNLLICEEIQEEEGEERKDLKKQSFAVEKEIYYSFIFFPSYKNHPNTTFCS